MNFWYVLAAVAVAVTVGSFSDPEDGADSVLRFSQWEGKPLHKSASIGARSAHFVLAECLERYADIFQNPGLNASWIWDEVQAVDSEHNKNRKSQEWRVESLINLMAADSSLRGETQNVCVCRFSLLSKAGLDWTVTVLQYCGEPQALATFG
eukprot:Skav206368  [mRNA]  locus=scaffold3448:468043:472929:- [translate_table: standard]